jgi:predicted enzyme related to lactoylglutathione lyase
MPTRENAPVGAPCWVDLMSSDPERAQTFYNELFDWTSEDPNPDFGGYFNFERNGVRIAGGMPAMSDAGPADVWSVYLATDDTRKTVDAAAANGGQIIAPAMDVADLGTMGVVADPGGAVIGMWQPATHKGFGVYGETGAPSWFELHTRDYDAVVAFYRDVFRWDTHATSDTPEFRYTTLGEGDDALAGIMDASAMLADGVPAHWSVYFGVDDTDAALDRIVELGGAVVMPAEDTPYGRLAAATDAMGAMFKLVG